MARHYIRLFPQDPCCLTQWKDKPIWVVVCKVSQRIPKKRISHNYDKPFIDKKIRYEVVHEHEDVTFYQAKNRAECFNWIHKRLTTYGNKGLGALRKH